MKSQISTIKCAVFCEILAVCFGGQPPNIIFFLLDDWGWNDANFHGMTDIPTPNIKDLAANGVTLNNYYVSPMCNPSRASLLTGRYSANTAFDQNFYDGEANGLNLNLTLMPQHLKRLGYVNRMVGKWHLGFFRKEYTPTFRGFEEHFGFWPGLSDYYRHESGYPVPPSQMDNSTVPKNCSNCTELLYMFIGRSFRDDLQEVTNLKGQYLTDLYTDRAKKIIKEHNVTKPLFMYLAHHGVHRGNTFQLMSAPDEYRDKFSYIVDQERRSFAGALYAVDKSLGEILKSLQEKNMLNNTIIVVSTDNGAPAKGTFTSNGGSNYPLRGQKETCFEGGIRANGFVWSPLIKNPGRFWNGLFHISDWLPTLYRAAGGDPADFNNDIDGFDMWNALQNDAESPRKEILIMNGMIKNKSAIIHGKYKMLSGDYSALDGRFGSTSDEISPLNDIVAKQTAIILEKYKMYIGDQPTDPTPSAARLEPIGLQKTPDNILNHFNRESIVKQVLKQFYGNDTPQNELNPFQINCNTKAMPNPTKCDTSKEVCLFDLESDPCEYNNIAKENPDILSKLQAKVTELFNKHSDVKSFAPLTGLADYMANPIFHENNWIPWRD